MVLSTQTVHPISQRFPQSEPFFATLTTFTRNVIFRGTLYFLVVILRSSITQSQIVRRKFRRNWQSFAAIARPAPEQGSMNEHQIDYETKKSYPLIRNWSYVGYGKLSLIVCSYYQWWGTRKHPLNPGGTFAGTTAFTSSMVRRVLTDTCTDLHMKIYWTTSGMSMSNSDLQ